MVFFIVSRILFVASMVFIIGYVFGSFSRNRTLTVLSKASVILVIMLFIGSSRFFFWRKAAAQQAAHGACIFHGADSRSTAKSGVYQLNAQR